MICTTKGSPILYNLRKRRLYRKTGRLADYDKMFLFGGIFVTLIASVMLYAMLGSLFVMSQWMRIGITILFFIGVFILWSFFSKEDNKFRKEIIAKGRERALENFTHGIIAKKTYDAYKLLGCR